MTSAIHPASLAPASARFTPSGARIPPAWTDVWIAKNAKSRIQATGRDAKGRHVYLYSAEYMGRANAAKFARLKAFDRVYPGLLRRVEQDKSRLEEALVLYLICKTGFRIGSNHETLAEKKAYGASTLKCSHVSVDGDRLEFDFPAKKGVEVKKELRDPFLAGAIGGRCNIGDGSIFQTTDGHIRAYLNSLPRGKDFLVKDIRTYIGTNAALRKIKSMPVPQNQTQFKRFRKEVGEVVAKELGNTPRIALNSYVAPEVFSAWESGQAHAQRKSKAHPVKELLRCVRYDKRVPARQCRLTDPLEKCC